MRLGLYKLCFIIKVCSSTSKTHALIHFTVSWRYVCAVIVLGDF